MLSAKVTTEQESVVLPTTPPLPSPQILSTAVTTEAVPTSIIAVTDASSAHKSPSAASVDGNAPAGKRPTRQWEAWTREEEETFFIALRHVGKNFDKITSRVQSKNKDQVRHYYYRLIRRINKILGPDFSLDAKNSKDVNSAMLRWWSLLEKQSCSASKLHLKPRRFKTFVTALEHQIMKDRLKASKKRSPRAVSVISGPMAVDQIARKPCACGSESVKTVPVDGSRGSKATSDHNNCIKQKIKTSCRKKREPSEHPRKRKKAASTMENWEKAAIAGVALVAEAAEQVERAAAETTVVPGSSLQPYSAQLAPGLTMEEKFKDQIIEQEIQASKLKLQLYPIDDATRICMTQDGLNPYLELTLKPRKAISSVLRHLIQKWGGTSAAVGRLHLFPFSVQTKSLDTTSQSWNVDDTMLTAEDVYAVLGSPAIFRLRYGWLPSRILQVSQAERSEAPSIGVREIARSANVFISQDIYNVSGPVTQMNEEEEKLHSHGQTSSQTAFKSQSLFNSNSVGLITNVPGLMKHSSCLDGINIGNPSSRFCEGSVGTGSPDKTVNKDQENGGSSWLYEGSNDSFVQRIWAVEGPENDAPLLPTEMDWADSLTNISVSEFLNEVSQAGRLTSGTSNPALQHMQSLDSFDAAVAAQSCGPIDSPHDQRETPIWDGEDTRDGFAFRRVVSQKQSLVPTQCNREPPNFHEAIRDSDRSILPFADCGSLEAWKQSFSHSDVLLPDELKSDSGSRVFHQQLEMLLKGGCSQDIVSQSGVMKP